jgi:hypothetical protein
LLWIPDLLGLIADFWWHFLAARGKMVASGGTVGWPGSSSEKGTLMRSAILFAVVLVAGTFVTGTARAEQLFFEVSGRSQTGDHPAYSHFNWRIGSDPYGSPISFLGPIVTWSIEGNSWVGVTQRTELPENSVINNAYRYTDLSQSTPLPVVHGFSIHMNYTGSGGAGGWSVRPDQLATTGSYSGGGLSAPLEVTSYLALPNGNSFVGTNYRFTAVEFTLDELDYGDSAAGRLPHLSFTARFFGVPEPTSAVLLTMGLCAVGHRRRFAGPIW